MENLSLKNFFRVFLMLCEIAIIIMVYRIYENQILWDEMIDDEFNARERRLRRRRRLETTGDRYWCLNTDNNEKVCDYMDFDRCERLGYETYLTEQNCENAKTLLEEREEDNEDNDGFASYLKY